MTDTKWLRRALLGGVALTVMASGAQADELAALKAQLEALQSRVNTLETQPAPAAQLPPGASFVTFERGSRMDFVAPIPVKDRINTNDDAGFTIAITPTADMPAPVAEIVVYGYVKGDVIYDLDGCGLASCNKYSFSMPSQDRLDRDDDEYAFLHANQSRFGIKSKVDTAVGQIRTRIEGDFESFTNENVSGGTRFHCDEFDEEDGRCVGAGTASNFGGQFPYRLRQAYGEWDMTPNWTLLVGQTEYTGALSIIGVTLVDFFGDAGINAATRRAQVRLTYHDGPLSWAVAMERPTEQSYTLMPDFASYVTYDIAGGHQAIIAGQVSDLGSDFNGDDDRELGWVVGGGANINLGDIATFTAGVQYTRGLAGQWMNQLAGDTITDFGSGSRSCEFDLLDDDVNCELQDAVGFQAGLTFNVNETTSINVEGGYAQYLDNDDGDNDFFDDVDPSLLLVDHVWTVHGNILWQPVKQMRMGWEVMWGRETFNDFRDIEGDRRVCDIDGLGVINNDDCESDALRIQWGTWFFF